MTSAEIGGRRSLFTRHAAAFIFLSSIVVIWPVYINAGNPFTMVDSFVYMDQGARIWGFIFDLLFASETSVLTANAGGDLVGLTQVSLKSAAADAASIRSLPYAAFVGLFLPFGMMAVVWVQTVVVMVVVYAFIAPALEVSSRLFIGLASLAMVTVSALPFISSFLMPDILGAVVIMYGVLLARGMNGFNVPSQVLLTLIVFFAVMSHYGNIPLAAAVFVVAMLARVENFQYVRRIAISAVLVFAAALGANTVFGIVAFDEASITPKRFPILLARSIKDGPARWYLEENCATEGYAVCEWWGDDIPTNVGDALWGPRGMERAPRDVYARIQEEEITILWTAFKQYPLQQVGALAGNSMRQFMRTGSGYAVVKDVTFDSSGRRISSNAENQPLQPYLSDVGLVQRMVYLAAFVYLLILAFNPSSKGLHRPSIVIIAVGILVNAAVFGGLSAPTDRYGARVAWLAVLAALAFTAERRAGKVASSPEPKTVGSSTS